jgi:hypothetical protein
MLTRRMLGIIIDKEILHFLYHPQSLATSLIDDPMQIDET